MHPDEAAVGVAQAILAVERLLAVEMRRERQLPVDQIVGMDAIGEAASGRQLGGELELRVGEAPRPVEPISLEFPGIGDIARRLEGGREADLTVRRR